MKTIFTALKKAIPTLTTCLEAVLFVEANTSTCYIFYQPETSKSLDRFKRALLYQERPLQSFISAE